MCAAIVHPPCLDSYHYVFDLSVSRRLMNRRVRLFPLCQALQPHPRGFLPSPLAQGKELKVVVYSVQPRAGGLGARGSALRLTPPPEAGALARPLVGRDEELQLVMIRAAALKEGHGAGGAIVIEGKSGELRRGGGEGGRGSRKGVGQDVNRGSRTRAEQRKGSTGYQASVWVVRR